MEKQQHAMANTAENFKQAQTDTSEIVSGFVLLYLYSEKSKSVIPVQRVK